MFLCLKHPSLLSVCQHRTIGTCKKWAFPSLENLAMECGTNCSICFSEYTTSGEHRVVALSCGHLFGSQCIEKWFGTKKTSNCPSCAVTVKKSQIRKIFATKIAALDTENEQKLIEKYLQEQTEKNKFKKQVNELQVQVECLKLELKALQENKNLETTPKFRLKKDLFKIIAGNYKFKNTIIEFDEINFLLILATTKSGHPGLQRYGCIDFSISEFVRLENVNGSISDFKISPYKDGLGLIAIGTTLKLINLCNSNIIVSFNFEDKVTSVCFDRQNRDLIYCGDERGKLYIIDLSKPNDEFKIKKICESALNSICMTKNGLHVSSIHNTYRLVFTGDHVVVNLELVNNAVHTNMSGYKDDAIITLREFDLKVKHYLCGARDTLISVGIKQVNRHRDRIYEGYIFMVDDSNRSIKVFRLETISPIYSYTFKEPVLDFCVNNDFFFVLTMCSIYIFQ